MFVWKKRFIAVKPDLNRDYASQGSCLVGTNIKLVSRFNII